MVGAHQNLNGSRDLTTPLSWMICHPRYRTCKLLLSTGLPNLNSLSPPTTKIWKLGIQNLETWVVCGSYGSLKVTENSAIRYHAYECLLAFHSNYSLSCTVSEIQREIGRKSPIWITPPLFEALIGGDPRNFAVIFDNCKLESLGVSGVVCRLSRTPTCDRRTDGRTDDSIYRASIASRGKNKLCNSVSLTTLF